MTRARTWNDQNLLPAQLGSVSFLVSSRHIEGGRTKAKFRYPYRDGQGVEDMGRTPNTFKLTIPLYRGMAADAENSDAIYPGTLDRIVEIVDSSDLRGEVEYVDPAYGVFRVSIMDYQWTEDAERQDGGVLTLTLEERGFEESLLKNVLSGKLTARARALNAAKDADYFFDVLLRGPDTTRYKRDAANGWTLANAWSKFQDLLDKGALTLDDAASRIDSVSFLAQRIMSFDVGDELSRWSLTNSCTSFMSAARDTTASAASKPGTTLVKYTVPGGMSSYEIAQALYQDASRADEITDNNPTSNPMLYQPGTVLMVPDR